MEVKVYRARPGARLSHKQAAAVGPELDALAAQHGGLDAGLVVEAARDDATALHQHFEWDDQIAAHEHRLQQARTLMRSVVVEVRVAPVGDEPAQSKLVPGFYHITVKQDRDGEDQEPVQRYLPLDVVTRTPDYLQQVITAAEREVEAWQDRYATYKSMAEFHARLGDVVAAVEANIQRRRQRVAATPREQAS